MWQHVLPLQRRFFSQQTLYYDRSDGEGWFEPNSWSLSDDPFVFDQEWIDGSIAQFGSGGAIGFRTDTNPPTTTTDPMVVNALLNSGNSIRFEGSGSEPIAIEFVGTNPEINGDFSFRGRTRLLGNFTLTGGTISVSGSGGGADPNPHTVTVAGGVFNMSKGNRLSSNTELVMTGGEFIIDGREDLSLGKVSLDGGVLGFGMNRGLGAISNVDILELQGGSAAVIQSTLIDGNDPSTGAISILTINQATDTTFAGSISGFGAGPNGDNTLQLVKSGTGDLTLSGNIDDLVRTTVVGAGGLFINSSSSSFGDSDGSTAILVETGARFGGNGSIGTLDGDHVVFEQGATLVAGNPGGVGQTVFALGAGSVLNLADAAGENGWMEFHLGSADSPGVSYDQVVATNASSSVDIGAGLMSFDDFNFVTIAGFGPGIYSLLSANSIIGSLAGAESLSGELDGFEAILSINDNNLLLTVIPEPKTMGLLAAMAAFILAACRRRSAGP